MQTFAFGSPGATVKGPDTPADERERAHVYVLYAREMRLVMQY